MSKMHQYYILSFIREDWWGIHCFLLARRASIDFSLSQQLLKKSLLHDSLDITSLMPRSSLIISLIHGGINHRCCRASSCQYPQTRSTTTHVMTLENCSCHSRKCRTFGFGVFMGFVDNYKNTAHHQPQTLLQYLQYLQLAPCHTNPQSVSWSFCFVLGLKSLGVWCGRSHATSHTGKAWGQRKRQTWKLSLSYCVHFNLYLSNNCI